MKKNLFFMLITAATLRHALKNREILLSPKQPQPPAVNPLPQQTTRFTALQLNAYMNPTLS